MGTNYTNKKLLEEKSSFVELVVMTLLFLISDPFHPSASKWNHKLPLLPVPHSETLNVASNKFPVCVGFPNSRDKAAVIKASLPLPPAL